MEMAFRRQKVPLWGGAWFSEPEMKKAAVFYRGL
jgi:hypothetical protein